MCSGCYIYSFFSAYCMSSDHARKGPTRKIKKLIIDIFFQHKINVCKYIVIKCSCLSLFNLKMSTSIGV